MIKIMKYGEVDNKEIFARSIPSVNVEKIVQDIIANVKDNKDQALFEYTEKFDKAKLKSLEVSKEEIEEAVKNGAFLCNGDCGNCKECYTGNSKQIVIPYH